jgi:AcrR family transcriptional regulator
MADTDNRQIKTRDRLLVSASSIFAQKGFRETTVAEICEAAGANISAVNYYFRSKEELYHEVWKRASEKVDEVYPLTPEDQQTPTAWLRALIRNRVNAIFDPGPGGCFPRLLLRELSDPSPMAQALREEFLLPRLKRDEAHVQELLGDGASDPQVRCCLMNIVSLFAFLNIRKLARQQLLGDETPTHTQLQAIVSQMQTFALAGVAGVRASIAAAETAP